MEFTPEHIDRLQRQMVARVFDVETPVTLIAADQLIRARIHPDVYAAAQHLRQIMHNGGSSVVRRIVEQFGYTGIEKHFPEIQPVLHAYREEEGDSQLLAEALQGGLVIAAMFDIQHFSQLFARVYAIQIREALQQRLDELYRQRPHIDLFQREVEEIQQEAARHAHGDAVESLYQCDIHPVMTTVRGHAGIEQDYALRGIIRVVDPVSQAYEIDISTPQRKQRFSVERQVTIPWDIIDDGIIVEIVFTAGSGHPVKPERLWIRKEDLTAMKQRGTAIPTHIGRKADVRLYPEWYTAAYSEESLLPEDPVASVRSTQYSVEVQKNVPNSRLTVFV